MECCLNLRSVVGSFGLLRFVLGVAECRGGFGKLRKVSGSYGMLLGVVGNLGSFGVLRRVVVSFGKLM